MKWVGSVDSVCVWAEFESVGFGGVYGV
jgi:hypothetical protein